MKLALVKPNDVSDSVQPNLGLGYLAAAAQGCEVMVIDAIRERLSPRGLLARLQAFQPDLVGFQVNSFSLRWTEEALLFVRQALPFAKVVLGGPHPTLCPLGTLERFKDLVDFIVIGEGEDAIAGLVERWPGGEVSPEVLKGLPGVAFHDGEGVKYETPSTVNGKWLSVIPRWDLMDPRTYPPSPHSAFFREMPVAPIIASRGCPFPCTFCAGGILHGRRVRYRPIEVVIEEIGLLRQRYGVREFHFVDDNLTSKAEYVHALCDAIMKHFGRLTWSCPNGVRLDTLDREVLRHMVESGCYALGFGIESGSPKVLKRMRKGITVDEVREKVALAHEMGLHTRGFFILGYPGEEESDIAATIKLALELPLDAAHFMFFHPIPGTAAYKEAEALGEINMDAPTFAEVAFVPKGLTASRLRSLRRAAFLKFYLRPKTLVGLLSEVRGPRHFYFIARRAIRWLT